MKGGDHRINHGLDESKHESFLFKCTVYTSVWSTFSDIDSVFFFDGLDHHHSHEQFCHCKIPSGKLT
jgi:hypothetical protein